MKVTVSSRYVTSGDSLFFDGGANGVMDRSAPPPLQTSQDVTGWTPDQREGKLWRWRERGGIPDVTSAATTPQGPAGHGNITCSLPKTPSFPPTPLPFYQYAPSTGLVPPLFGLDGPILPPFSPPTLSSGLQFLNLFFPSCLSSFLCCVMLLHLGFNYAKELNIYSISVLR